MSKSDMMQCGNHLLRFVAQLDMYRTRSTLEIEKLILHSVVVKIGLYLHCSEEVIIRLASSRLRRLCRLTQVH